MTDHQFTTSQLVPFAFHEKTVTAITDAHGEPWFIAAEVCEALEVKNVSQALSRLDTDEKDIILNDTLRGKQEMSIISEAGLYRLALSSRKRIAKEFQRWITHEVLPAIRKTGHYEAEPITHGDLLVQMAEAYRAQEQRLVAIEEAHKAQQAQRLEDQAALIVLLQHAQRAEDKADIALQDASYFAVEQFVMNNSLIHQFPPAQWQTMSAWCKRFCQEYGIEIRKAPVYGKPWDEENAYPWHAFSAYMRYERKRPHQITLVKEETP